MLKKAILYLGLGPDEEYDSYHAYADAQPVAEEPPELVFDTPPEPVASSGLTNVRPISDAGTAAAAPTAGEQSAPGAPPAAPPPARPGSLPKSPVVRTLPPIVTAKPSTVAPTSFNDAQEIGDRYAANQPVIINLQGADRDLARRLIDFASGLCYGLGGEMERVANQVYLLTPADVELPDDERERLMGDSSPG